MNPKEKPINLILGSHRPESEISANNVLLYDSLARPILEGTPEGVVALFIEAANVSHVMANMFEFLSRKNVPLSKLHYFAEYIDQKGSLKEASKEELEEFARSGRPPLNLFDSTKEMVIDQLMQDFPQRIAVVYESCDPDKDDKEETREANLNPTDLVNEGQFVQAVEAFDKANREMASESNHRDLAFRLKMTRVISDPQVIGLVGFLGSAHTRPYHDLIKLGYNVTRHFPEKYQGDYFYPAPGAYQRLYQFKPDLVTKRARDFYFIAYLANSFFIDVTEDAGEDVEDQSIVLAAYYFAKSLYKNQVLLDRFFDVYRSSDIVSAFQDSLHAIDEL